MFFFFKQKTAYEIQVSLEFRRVLFRSQAEDGIRDSSVTGVQTYAVFCLRSEEHTSELQSHLNLVCRLLLEKKTSLYRFSCMRMPRACETCATTILLLTSSHTTTRSLDTRR